MELTRGTIFVTADVEIGLLEEMHIERWYRPGLHGVYIRKHTEYDVTYPKEERKHIQKMLEKAIDGLGNSKITVQK